MIFFIIPPLAIYKILFIIDFNELFLGSSVVEQAAVNRLVAGSNPARGAISLIHHVDT